MAWIYLAESVDYPLPLHPGQDHWPIARPTDSAKACCCPECGRVTLRAPQSGTMCGRCIQNHLEARSILSGEAFLARISPWPDLDLAWLESEADWSLIYSATFAVWSRDSCSWKMSQQSLLADLDAFSENWPTWGTIQDGHAFQQQRLEPSIFENDGSYLPTPTACDYGKNVGRKSDGITPSGRDRWSLTVRARRGELPGHPRGSLNPQWIEQAMGYPAEWTDITDWAIPWCQRKRGKRSGGSVESSVECVSRQVDRNGD
jgi:hypothetical protein